MDKLLPGNNVCLSLSKLNKILQIDAPISCKTLMKDLLYIEYTELTLALYTLLVLLVAFHATKLAATLQVAILLFTAKVQVAILLFTAKVQLSLVFSLIYSVEGLPQV